LVQKLADLRVSSAGVVPGNECYAHWAIQTRGEGLLRLTSKGNEAAFSIHYIDCVALGLKDLPAEKTVWVSASLRVESQQRWPTLDVESLCVVRPPPSAAR
jgi:hypothetical protein